MAADVAAKESPASVPEAPVREVSTTSAAIVPSTVPGADPASKSQQKKRKKKEKAAVAAAAVNEFTLDNKHDVESAKADSPAAPGSVVAADDAAFVAASKNPFVEQINKRLRTLKKKLGRVEKYEEIYNAPKANGKAVNITEPKETTSQLNADQIAAIKNKGQVTSAIKELEELKQTIEKVVIEEEQRVAKERTLEQQATQEKIEAATEAVRRENDQVIVRLLQLIVFATQVQHNPHLSQTPERLAATHLHTALTQAAFRPSPDFTTISAQVNDLFAGVDSREVHEQVTFAKLSEAMHDAINPPETPSQPQSGTLGSGDAASQIPSVNLPHSGRLNFMNASEIYDQPPVTVDEAPKETPLVNGSNHYTEAAASVPAPITVPQAAATNWASGPSGIDWADQDDDSGFLPTPTFHDGLGSTTSATPTEAVFSDKPGNGNRHGGGRGRGGGSGGRGKGPRRGGAQDNGGDHASGELNKESNWRSGDGQRGRGRGNGSRAPGEWRGARAGGGDGPRRGNGNSGRPGAGRGRSAPADA